MSAGPYRGGASLPGWWTGLRGLPLAFLALPQVPALFLALASGEGAVIGGTVAGLSGVVLAMRRLKRARRGDARRASALLGVGTGLSAALAGGAGPLGGVVLGLMAWGGARLLYDGVAEVAPPPPPPGPRLDGLDPLRARLAGLRGRADARIAAAVQALEGLLGEVAARPGEGATARRMLVVGLDGLERIALRLEQGAEPPPTLPRLVDDLARAARDAGRDLRSAETEALSIQVKVLQDRLRQEGMA